MISFRTILSEALGTPYPWNWTGIDPTAEYVKDPKNVHRRAFVARFHTRKDMAYLVRFGRNVPQKGNDEDLIIYEPRTPANFIHNNWSVGFNLDEDTLERLRAERNDPKLLDDVLLKTGDAFRVYATVTDIVKKFLVQVNPDSIEFEAFEDEPSRVSFYTHLIRKVNDENIFPNHKGISLGKRFMDGKPAKAFAIVPKSATITGGKVLRTPQRASGLTEAASSPYPFRWSGVPPTKGDTHEEIYRANFVTDQKIEFNWWIFESIRGGRPTNEWSLGFRVSEKSQEELKQRGITIKSYGITGLGDAFRIMATAIAILKEFITAISPKTIAFVASEESRQKLYRRMMTLIPAHIPGYEGREVPGHPGLFSVSAKTSTVPITESVNKPFAWQWDPKSTEDDRIADFKTDIGPEKTEQIYHVNIYRSFENDKMADAGYHAADDRADDAVSQKWFLNFSLIDRDGVHQGGIENTGQAGRVFATLGAILKDFITKERPESVGFSGTGKSRQKLYARLMRALTALNLPYAGRVVSPTEFEIYPRENTPVEPTGLTESGDAPYTDIKWYGGGSSSRGRGRTVVFTTDAGIQYYVTFTKEMPGDNEDDDDDDYYEREVTDTWDIEFKLSPESLLALQLKARVRGDPEPYGPYDIVGAGDAFRVLATITQIVKQFVATVDPEEMTFTASEKSRIKLYDRFEKNAQQVLPNHIVKSRMGAGGFGGTKYYTITKRPFRRTPPATPPATPVGTHATYADTPTTKPPVTEALTDAYPWAWHAQLPAVANSVNGWEMSGGMYEAEFSGEYTYDVVFRCTRLSFVTNQSHGTAIEWECMFSPNWDSWDKMRDKDYHRRQAAMDAGKVPSNRRIGPYRTTGAGDEFRVMATVVNIMLDFMKREKPDVIKFTADQDEPSRAKLYKRLTEKVHTMAPDYFGKAYPAYDGQYVFRLIRRDAPPLKIGMLDDH